MYRPEEPGRPQRCAGQQPNWPIDHEGPGRRKGVANLRVQSVHRHRDGVISGGGRPFAETNQIVSPMARSAVGEVLYEGDPGRRGDSGHGSVNGSQVRR